MGQITISAMRVPRPLVRCLKISSAASISSCPVKNTRTSPVGWRGGEEEGGRGKGSRKGGKEVIGGWGRWTSTLTWAE